MFYILSAGVFCLSLAFFLYRLKREKKLEVDHSHIIFKDYSSQKLEASILSPDKEAGVEGLTIKEKDLQGQQMGKSEDTPMPTLNFED